MTDYNPANMKISINTVGGQFKSKEEFESSVRSTLNNLESEQNGNLPELNDRIEAMIELNAKPTASQLADPEWKRKLWNLHNAYSITKAEPGYHKNRPEKILAFTSSLPMAIGVGTTKKAIMKFWIGSGVLELDDNDFDQNILSPKQLEAAKFKWEDVNIPGLDGKNFHKIRVVEP